VVSPSAITPIVPAPSSVSLTPQTTQSQTQTACHSPSDQPSRAASPETHQPASQQSPQLSPLLFSQPSPVDSQPSQRSPVDSQQSQAAKRPVRAVTSKASRIKLIANRFLTPTQPTRDQFSPASPTPPSPPPKRRKTPRQSNPVKFTLASYQCTICAHSAKKPGKLSAHYRIKHSTIHDPLLQSTYPGTFAWCQDHQTFYTSQGWALHVKNSHSGRDPISSPYEHDLLSEMNRSLLPHTPSIPASESVDSPLLFTQPTSVHSLAPLSLSPSSSSPASHYSLLSSPVSLRTSPLRFDSPASNADMDMKHPEGDLGTEADELGPLDSPVTHQSLLSLPGGADLPDKIGGIPIDHPIWADVIALTEHPRLWKDPPTSSHIHLQLLFAPTLLRFTQAHHDEDTEARERALLEFYGLPGRALIRGRGGVAHNAKRDLITHLSHITYSSQSSPCHSPRSPVSPPSTASQPPTPPSLPPSPPAASPSVIPDPDTHFSEHETRLAKRAAILASARHDGKGVRALLQQPLADASDPLVQKVLSKAHQINPDPYSGRPDIPATATVDADEFGKLHINRMCTLAAADAYGFTGEILRALWPNQTCREGISLLLELQANNALTPTERVLSTVCLVIPGNKKPASLNPIQPSIIVDPLQLVPDAPAASHSSSSYPAAAAAAPASAPKIRAINIPPVFVKAASLNQHNHITNEDLAMVCPSPQLAVGVAGGSTAAVLRIQTFCDVAHTKPQRQLLISTDIVNAFGDQDRKVLIDTCVTEPMLEPIHNLTLFSYESSSLVITKHNGKIAQVLVSDRGSRQGERDAGTLFCASMVPHYKEVTRGLPKVQATVLTDDCSMHGEAGQVIQAFDQFAASITNNSSLTLHPAKQKALWPYQHEKPPSWLIEALSERNITLYSAWMPMHGAAVGVDPTALSRWARGEMDLQQDLFRLLTHPAIPPREAHSMQTKCALPKAQSIFNGMKPSVTKAAAVRWNELNISTILTICGLSPSISSVAQFQISLPINLSGLGIASAEITAVTGWMGSMAYSAHAIRPLLPRNQGPLRSTPLFTEIAQCIDAIRQFGVNIGKTQIKSSPSNFINHFYEHKATRLQHELTRAVHAAHLKRVLSRLPRRDSERITHHSGPGKSAFLTVAPTRPEFFTGGHLFRVLVRNRLGVLLEGAPAICGLCGKCAADPLHYLDCPACRSQERLYLHNQIRAQVERFTRSAGGQYHTEPRLDDREDHSRRGDSQLFLPAPAEQIFIDVQCINPLSPAHITGHASCSSTVLKRAESMKVRKYRAAAEAVNATFVPFIVTVQCDIGQEASALLAKLESRCEVTKLDSKLLLSLTIQRAAARAQLWAAARCFSNRFRHGRR
jgi:hypothetical protein